MVIFLLLTGPIPSKHWMFHRTNFSGELPSSIGNLHSLNYFDITGCGFDSHVPFSFGNLTQLSFLEMASFHDVSAGQFLVPDSLSCFGKLTKLNYLGLSDINLRGNFPRFVANLTQLTHLDLLASTICKEKFLSRFSTSEILNILAFPLII